MSCLAIITARGGSKRIPRKNIKNFLGKPMIAYAIDAAKNAHLFDEIMVSTEDKEIAQIARQYGAHVPFMRSQATANDYATTADVLREVIAQYAGCNKHFEHICCIYPCVPLLQADTLRDAYEKFTTSNADALFPVVKFSFPIQRALRKTAEGFAQYREPENANKRSQDLEPMYHDAGMFYFYKSDKIGSGRAIMYEIDETFVQDIDTPADWKMAELKYKILKGGNIQ